MKHKSHYAVLGIPDFSPYVLCERAWNEKMAHGINVLTSAEVSAYAMAWYTLKDNTRKYHYDVKLQRYHHGE